jgi:hypothetical protein
MRFLHGAWSHDFGKLWQSSGQAAAEELKSVR